MKTPEERKIERLEEKYLKEKENRGDADLRIAELEKEKKYFEQQFDHCQEIIAFHQQRMELVESSLSWRITQPIRWMGDFARRCRSALKRTKPVLAEPPIPEETVQSDDLYEEYVRKILSIPTGIRSEEYVPWKEETEFVREDGDLKYLAFYLPQFHTFPENDAWWGKGFTEWSNVTKAVPVFAEHYQPRLAGELGYYDLSNYKAIQAQMELAKRYGIYGFCIYYYWFDGKTLMEKPLELILEHSELDLPICLCWANENWSRRWDGLDQDILIKQEYDDTFPLRFIRDVEKYFRDSRYIRVDGKPLFIVYKAADIPDLPGTIKIWREYCRECGIGEIHLLAVDFHLNEQVRMADFDGFVEFPPHSVAPYALPVINDRVHLIEPEFQGGIFDYQQIVREKKYLNSNEREFYKSTFLGWDNSARKKNGATIFTNFSIAAFKEWLIDIGKFTKENRAEDNFVFINAWNEWAEGTYLEPDKKYGVAALNAVKESLEEVRKYEPRKRLIYVSHDACFNGAQMLSLNIIRQLKENFKIDVFCILKKDGVLREEFKKYSKELFCMETDMEEEGDLRAWVRRSGAKSALCNTVVVGDVLKILSGQGVSCISLIHEMEKVIREYSCEQNLEYIKEYAEKIIFASDYVRNSVETVCGLPEEKVVIQPQGMYYVNTLLDKKDVVRREIREKYRIPEDAFLVLGVGFGDYRKGVDLFLKTAEKVARESDNVYFMWVGDIEPSMSAFVSLNMSEELDKSRLIFAHKQEDTMPFYTAADLYLLTSREDPFPTVVMEAMDSCLPVIAFKDGGGYVENIGPGRGKLVPMEDTDAMAAEVIYYYNEKDQREIEGKNCRDYVESRFDFVEYVYRLLEFMGIHYDRVSVVVPNYNYERYLSERLDSILKQTYPISEILLLDDMSKDNSREIMDDYKQRYPLLIKTFYQTNNSGNVFVQWDKGLKLSKSEYIWIAEADDLSDKCFLQRVMAGMKLDDSVVLGYTQSNMMDENGNVTDSNYFCYTDDVDDKIWRSDYLISAKQELLEHMTVKNTIPNVSGIVLKRQDFSEGIEAAKHFSVAGDWMFYVSLLKNGGKVFFASDSLNYHRRHSHSVTSDLNRKKHFEEICKMQDYVCGEILGIPLTNKAVEYRIQVKKYLQV